MNAKIIHKVLILRAIKGDARKTRLQNMPMDKGNPKIPRRLSITDIS